MLIGVARIRNDVCVRRIDENPIHRAERVQFGDMINLITG